MSEFLEKQRQCKFLITGHSRSGTGYMAALMRKFGFKVGHERLRDDGVSAWMYAVYAESYPYTDLPPRHTVKFERIIHVVRRPLAVINSVYNTDQRAEPAVNFRRRYIDIDSDLLIGTVQSVIRWNRLVSTLNPDITVQVESAPQAVADVLMVWGYRSSFELPPELPGTDHNTRNKMTWKCIAEDSLRERLPNKLFEEYKSFEKEYGYEGFI